MNRRERLRTGRRGGPRLASAAGGLVAIAFVAGPLALLVHSRWSPLLDLDRAVTRVAEQADRSVPGLLGLAGATTNLGDPFLLSTAAGVLALVLVARGQRRLAVLVVLSRVGALLLSGTLKAAVDRVRPVFDQPVTVVLGPSFPSGHALGAAAFWSTVAVLLLPHVRRPWTVLMMSSSIAAVVAASRVLLGVHYLSDVLGGLLLGWGWTAVCAATVRPRSRPEPAPPAARSGLAEGDPDPSGWAHDRSP